MFVRTVMSDSMIGGAWGAGEENDQCYVDFNDYLMHNGKNGIILDGVLTWIDVQQRKTADHVWRNQANTWFTEEEVMKAKEALWRVCGDRVELIGKVVNRTSDDKINVTTRRCNRKAEEPGCSSSPPWIKQHA